MAYVAKELKKTADISRGRKSPRRLLEYTLGLLIFLVAIYFVTGFFAYVVAIWIPDSWEAKIGFGELPGIVEEDDRLDSLNRLLEGFVSKSVMRELPYSIQIMDTNTMNAFATPGGDIWLTTGLLDSIENEAAIAFVIAHELGHHEGRHVLKRMSRSLMFRLLLGLLFGLDASGFGNSAYALMELDYSRKQELEADRFAHGLIMAHLGDDSDGYLEVLETFVATEQSMSPFSGYLRTHPHSADRIKALQELSAAKE